MLAIQNADVKTSFLKDLLSYIEGRYISYKKEKEITIDKKGAIVDYVEDKDIKKLYWKINKCC